MQNFLKIFLLILFVPLMNGCPLTESLTGYHYNTTEARQVQTVRYGHIIKMEDVRINGSGGDVGTLGGAALGGIAGSSLGGGKGKMLGAVGGALAGGIAGKMIGEGVTAKNAINFFVKLCSGETISVIQENDPKRPLKIGDPVSVLSGHESTRVTYDTSAQCMPQASYNSNHR